MRPFIASLISAAALLPVIAHGQAFTNLDFEAAQVVPNDPDFGFLDWNLAVPGWGHSAGSDTGAVYHGLTHVGTTQWYLLADASSQPQNLLAGSYSMVLSSGYSSSDPLTAVWTQAYLAQTGSVPLGTQTLQLLATGSFAVYVGGQSIPMLSLGGSAYGGDVSAYAGTDVELRIVNVATDLYAPVAIDNIQLLPVPELGTVWLASAGLVSLLLARRRRVSALDTPTRCA